MTGKKRALRVCLVIALILLIFLVGYTFAKYYSEIKGGGSGSIAKWSFVANSDKDSIQTISLANSSDYDSLVDGKIAPGTSGSFDIIIDATGSEVGVDYQINVSEETNLPQNLKYKAVVDGQETEEYDSLTELAENHFDGSLDTLNGENKKTITVKWNWPYETVDSEGKTNTGDSLDLADGTKENLDYEFVLQIIGTQAA